MLENDALFDCLASVRRRELLVDLLDDDPRSVPELSDESREILGSHEAFVSEFLSGTGEVANTDKDAIRLYHVHLPKLTDCEFVEWDRDARFVSQGARFVDAEPLLELLDEQREDAPEKEVRFLTS